MKLTRHNGRAGKNGAYNPKHNDRSFNISVIRQIKCGLLPQIKNNFLRYAEALQSVLFATISAHCFM